MKKWYRVYLKIKYCGAITTEYANSIDTKSDTFDFSKGISDLIYCDKDIALKSYKNIDIEIKDIKKDYFYRYHKNMKITEIISKEFIFTEMSSSLKYLYENANSDEYLCYLKDMDNRYSVNES